ncbi:MAG: response regulator [Bacteroidales bacterium]
MHRVLIVDDDKDIRASMEALLATEFLVSAASGKNEALSELRGKNKPDIVLLDVKMKSEQEGFEFAAEIDKDPELKKIPIIIVSSIEALSCSFAAAEIAREMREKYGYSNLDVLVLRAVTGEVVIDFKSDKSNVSVCIQVAGFHSKPVQPKKLIHEIKAILDQ